MENTWYNKYCNQKKILNNKNVDQYINLFKQSEKFINKINKLEDTFNEDIENLEKEGNNINLLIKELNLKTSLEVLQKESHIIKLLSKYALQNNNLNYTFFYNSLILLINISNILRERLKQPKLKHEDYDINTFIPRCSYKFCNFRGSCGYNYNDKKQMCYQDHYVHNMVSADLLILSEYIQLFKNNNILTHNKEILKSINTLSFVINHMEKELKSKCLYQNKNDWNNFHYTKKIVKKIIKNKVK